MSCEIDFTKIGKNWRIFYIDCQFTIVKIGYIINEIDFMR